MKRFVGLVDLGVLTILIAAVVFPPREMYADSAVARASADEHFGLALAEARAIARPEDPNRVENLQHLLGELNFKDWAVEVSVDGAARTSASPEHWRSLLAASVAYIERLEAKPALKWAVDAYKACEKVGEPACPSWEKTRMEIYRDHIQAGVDAGIDPKRNPKAFRDAGEGKIRATRIGPSNDRAPAPNPAAPTP